MSTAGSTAVFGPGAVPPARRASRPGWRDPRLWIGVAIVAASVVAGARLLAGADDTVSVWSVAAAHGAGDDLGPDDLSAVRVRFADAARLDDYLPVDQELPADLALTRPVGAGELLPRAALGRATDTGLAQVPLAVAPEQVPGTVVPGSVVDVYLVPSSPTDAGGAGSSSGADPGAAGPGAGDPAGAGPALAGMTVLEAPAVGEGLGVSGTRQLVLAVPADLAPGFFARLGALQSPVVTVVRRG